MTTFFACLFACLFSELVIYLFNKYKFKVFSKIILKLVPSSNTRVCKNREYTLKDLDKSFWEEE